MAETLAEVINGAQLTRVIDDAGSWVVLVWHGGTTVNVWVDTMGGTWKNTTCFNVSDELGRPLGIEEMQEKLREYEAVVKAEMEGER